MTRIAFPATTHRLSRRRALVTLTVGLVLALSGILLSSGLGSPSVDAMAACVAHQNTAEEMTFLSQLQAWRNQNIPGSYQLTLSGPLNAAAAGYAQFLANTPGAAGHYADASSWVARAVSCGYPQSEAAGGEGLGVIESSSVASLDPSQGLGIMTAEPLGGVHIPANVGAPVRCVGVAKAVSADGHKVAWVTLLFAAFNNCAQAVIGGGTTPSPTATTTGTTTATSTATNTPTATLTNTPTPTPSPTPAPQFGTTISISSGWNLVSLPGGSIANVLARAGGCFTSVYAPSGEGWLRYSTLVPAWANNLFTVDGAPVWINGTGAAGCTAIQL